MDSASSKAMEYDFPRFVGLLLDAFQELPQMTLLVQGADHDAGLNFHWSPTRY